MCLRHPFMGKKRLSAMLALQGLHLPEPAIGRILAKGARLLAGPSPSQAKAPLRGWPRPALAPAG